MTAGVAESPAPAAQVVTSYQGTSLNCIRCHADPELIALANGQKGQRANGPTGQTDLFDWIEKLRLKEMIAKDIVNSIG